MTLERFLRPFARTKTPTATVRFDMAGETLDIFVTEYDVKADSWTIRLRRRHAAPAIEKAIADALGTAERGVALIEVARNAHAAEQELAALKRKEQESDGRSYRFRRCGTGAALA
jgi:hypothetical protein